MIAALDQSAKRLESLFGKLYSLATARQSALGYVQTKIGELIYLFITVKHKRPSARVRKESGNFQANGRTPEEHWLTGQNASDGRRQQVFSVKSFQNAHCNAGADAKQNDQP